MKNKILKNSIIMLLLLSISFIYAQTQDEDGNPDAMIKLAEDSEWTGNNIFNEDGTDQTIEGSTEGETIIYHIKVENDIDNPQSMPDRIKITGTAGDENWEVKYYDDINGGNDITSSVIVGWETDYLPPQAYVVLRAEVTPKEANSGDSFELSIEALSTNNDSKKDVVKAITSLSGIEENNNNMVRNIKLIATDETIKVEYSLAKITDVSIVVYDIQGKKIKNLIKGKQKEGLHSIVWNKTDNQNNKIANGVYLVVLNINRETIVKKAIVTR